MKAQNIAAKLYSLRKQHKDDNIWLLSALNALKESNIEEVLINYTKISNQETKIVQITSSVKLSETQKIFVITHLSTPGE